MPSNTARLSVVLFITDWNSQKLVTQILEKTNVQFRWTAQGRGTANSEILNALGIGATSKAVLLVLERDAVIRSLLQEVSNKLRLEKPGAGVACTIPLSSVNLPVMNVFNELMRQELAELLRRGDATDQEHQESAEATVMSDKKRCDLIFCILNQGYSDEFMAVAREAGAGGGTVISARGTAHKGQVKFFGISVQDEKEIIIILTTHEKKTRIMSAVSEKYGIASDAEGIVFSVPVDNITGIELR
jgi:hypothetical protein